MMLEKELRNETEKWLRKIEEKRKGVELKDKSKKGMLKNIDAYISDTRHFLEKNDFIRAFEAVIWAWANLELMEELKFINTE